ncbi:MAG: fluoride efflux transporter CrcB [Alcanivoracaceae bacterium]|nr:fluoride efflux transporter CrcB [Alcanivoracaceae bacterium]
MISHSNWHFLAVALGGALGAVMRYALAVRWLGVAEMPAWPWATFVANLSGAFAFGFLAVALSASAMVSDNLRLLLMTGLLGAFTTYSTFSFEMVRMLELKAVGLALGYGMGTMAACVTLAGLGLWLGRLLFE